MISKQVLFLNVDRDKIGAFLKTVKPNWTPKFGTE